MTSRRSLTRAAGLRLAAVVFGLAVLALTAQHARAETYSWTLGEVVERAREHSPSLERSRMAEALSRGEARSSWNVFLPDLELGGSMTRDIFPEEGAESPWTAGVSASASVSISPAAGAEIHGRGVGFEAAVLNREQAELEVVQAARRRFYAVLLERERLRIAERNVQVAEQRLAQIRSLYERGRASELELLEARQAAIGRRPALLSRRQALVTQEAGLKELTGLAPQDTVDLSGEIALPDGVPALSGLDRRMLEELVMANSPALRAARLEVRELETARAVAFRDNKLPRVSAAVNYGPRVSPPFDGQLWQERETWETGSVSLRLTVPLDPLIPRSRADNRVRAASGAVSQAESRLAEEERALERAAAEGARVLSILQEKIEVLTEAREVALMRYRRTAEAYESGGVELLDVENARTDLEQAELELLQARYDLVLTVVDLDARAGGMLIQE